MSIAADNKKLRALLERVLSTYDPDGAGAPMDGEANLLLADIRAALASIPEPSLHEVEIGAVDKVAVILDPDDARALAEFVSCGDTTDMESDLAERFEVAILHGILAYDGPDGEDGRAFTDASGKPHYEP